MEKKNLCVTGIDECMKVKNRRDLHFGDNSTKLFQ